MVAEIVQPTAALPPLAPKQLKPHSAITAPLTLPVSLTLPLQASRKQYCINRFAQSKPSVDEACEELRQDGQVGWSGRAGCGLVAGVEWWGGGVVLGGGRVVGVEWRTGDGWQMQMLGVGWSECGYMHDVWLSALGIMPVSSHNPLPTSWQSACPWTGPMLCALCCAALPQCKYHKNFMTLVTGGFSQRVGVGGVGGIAGAGCGDGSGVPASMAVCQAVGPASLLAHTPLLRLAQWVSAAVHPDAWHLKTDHRSLVSESRLLQASLANGMYS